MPLHDTTAASCVHCPIGRAAGVGRGGRCPFEPRRYRDGELLCSAGDAADTVWYVKRGLVALSSRGAAGREVGHLVVAAGGLVGAEALRRPAYSDTARAIGAATLCSARRGLVEAWLGPAGSPARVLLELLIDTRVVPAPRGAGIDASAIARMARWLAEAATGELLPAIERRFVASVLGMAPETLSRVLGRLVAAGAVVRAGRALRIRDRPLLVAVGAGLPVPRLAGGRRPQQRSSSGSSGQGGGGGGGGGEQSSEERSSPQPQSSSQPQSPPSPCPPGAI